MSAFKYFMKIDIVKYVKPVKVWLSECSVGDPEQRWLKLKHAWQFNSGLCFYWWQQATHRQYKFNMNSGWLGCFKWGYAYMALKRQKLSSRFRCKLSSKCMCSHISCPGWRNSWHMWYLYWLSYLCVIKFGLNSRQWQILPVCYDKVVN